MTPTPDPIPDAAPHDQKISATNQPCDVSVVIISYNRLHVLEKTVSELMKLNPRPAEIVIVDNASTDGTSDRFANVDDVRVIALRENLGIEAFNFGASSAQCSNLLILDDDAVPDARSWKRAIALLQDDATLDAVAFNPVHPSTGTFEWPDAINTSRRFNRMGCANLIRTRAWRDVGGYLGAYFLYRNDTDFALTLLARGGTIAFDPSLLVFHDSPFAARKSERWLHLATRNWIWMGRRHGRGVWRHLGIFAGIAKAISTAGLSWRRIRCVLQGTSDGFRLRAPALGIDTDGAPWKALIISRFRSR